MDSNPPFCELFRPRLRLLACQSRCRPRNISSVAHKLGLSGPSKSHSAGSTAALVVNKAWSTPRAAGTRMLREDEGFGQLKATTGLERILQAGHPQLWGSRCVSCFAVSEFKKSLLARYYRYAARSWWLFPTTIRTKAACPQTGLFEVLMRLLP